MNPTVIGSEIANTRPNQSTMNAASTCGVVDSAIAPQIPDSKEAAASPTPSAICVRIPVPAFSTHWVGSSQSNHPPSSGAGVVITAVSQPMLTRRPRWTPR